jgi:hypothetical protein
MNPAGWLVSAGRFFYGFVVGDDWRVAAVVVLALIATAVLVANGINAWWLVPPVAVAMTAVAISNGTQRREIR